MRSSGSRWDSQRSLKVEFCLPRTAVAAPRARAPAHRGVGAPGGCHGDAGSAARRRGDKAARPLPAELLLRGASLPRSLPRSVPPGPAAAAAGQFLESEPILRCPRPEAFGCSRSSLGFRARPPLWKEEEFGMFHHFTLGSGGSSSAALGITCHLSLYWKKQSSEKLPRDLPEKIKKWMSYVQKGQESNEIKCSAVPRSAILT
ncbi:uncharacterized protein AAEQ78_003117 [Lycaon pictus]